MSNLHPSKNLLIQKLETLHNKPYHSKPNEDIYFLRYLVYFLK
nr:MAG TPA: hypothetical protein [Caudoviricetes sp.]